MPAPLPPPPPLDLDALGAVALWREMLPNGELGYLREFATDEPYVALHSATYAALVAELRAAREKIAALPAASAVEAGVKVETWGVADKFGVTDIYETEREATIRAESMASDRPQFAPYRVLPLVAKEPR